MSALLRRIPSGKDGGEVAQDSASKRKGRFSFLCRASQTKKTGTEIGAGKKKRKALRWKASLTRLLTVGSWDQIRDLLNDSDVADVERWIGDATDFMGQTALHHALRLRAPLDVVCLLMDCSSSCCPEQSCDCSGRTPLHVAAGWGSGADVVARLLRGGPTKVSDLVKAKDFDGRTALHLACFSNTALVASSLPKHAKKEHSALDNEDFLENRREVVRVLLDASSKVATAADNAGKLPLDYAIEKNDDQQLICMLRGVTKKVGLQKSHHHRTHRPDKANRSCSLLASQSYNRSTHYNKNSLKDYRLRMGEHNQPSPRGNSSFLLDGCPEAAIGSEEREKSPKEPVKVPFEIQCAPYWKDDVSAITQPRGLESVKVVMAS